MAAAAFLTSLFSLFSPCHAGNSGGPLLNSAGQVVGVNTAIYSGSGTSSGVGFALPSDAVAGVVDQIIATGRVSRPYLGISFAPDGVAAQLGLGGVLVLEAQPGGPAAAAGVRSTSRDDQGRLRLGDVIVAVDGAPVKASGDLYKALDRHGVGDTLALQVERGGGQSGGAGNGDGGPDAGGPLRLTLRVTLADRAAAAAEAAARRALAEAEAGRRLREEGGAAWGDGEDSPYAPS